MVYEMHDVSVENRGFNDINPLQLGYQQCEPNHSYGPHIRDHYLLHYVVSGKGELLYDNEVYKVEEGDIFVIRPNEINTYTADEKKPWKYIWIGFDGKLCKYFDRLTNPVIHCPNSIFQEMTECEKLENAREEFLTGKIFLLLSMLAGGEKPQYDYVKKACDYIDANYVSQIHVGNISNIIGVDRTYLSKIFRQKMGVSMQQYLINVRMHRAKLLLKNGFSVSDSAVMVGYNDVFNFSKMFKKQFRLSPQQYQKEKL